MQEEDNFKDVRKKISEETRQQIHKLTLMNNAFMNLVLENNCECTEEILRIIINRDDLFVKSVRTQKMFQGFERSVCLDVYAEDSEHSRYNIEIQRSNEGANPKRARFHTGMIDAHSLKAGQNFNELPNCYVIFITLNDVLGLGKAIYTIHKYIDDELSLFDDGSHTIYINTSAKNDNSEIWKLIHDLRCENPDEMYLPQLSARVKFLKGQEKGSVIVGDYFEELQAKAVAQAVANTERQQAENIVKNLLLIGKLTLEEIAKGCGLTVERVQAIAKTL